MDEWLLCFILGKPKTHHSHDFRTYWTWPWLPKPILVIFGDARICQIIWENPKSFDKMWKSHNFGSRTFWTFRNRLGKFPKIRVIFFKNLESGISISQNTWHWNSWHYWKRWGPTNPDDPSNIFSRSWIWDQYLSKNMKLKVGNMGSISSPPQKLA